MNAPLHAHERLRDARIAAGFESASSAAAAMHVARATYVQHENGTRQMTVQKFDAYMAFFARQERGDADDAPPGQPIP